MAEQANEVRNLCNEGLNQAKGRLIPSWAQANTTLKKQKFEMLHMATEAEYESLLMWLEKMNQRIGISAQYGFQV